MVQVAGACARGSVEKFKQVLAKVRNVRAEATDQLSQTY